MGTTTHTRREAAAPVVDRVLSGLLPPGSSWATPPTARPDYLVFSGEAGPRLILPSDVRRGLNYTRTWARNGSPWKWAALRTAYRLHLLRLLPGVDAYQVSVPETAGWDHLGAEVDACPVIAVFVRDPSPSQKAVAFAGRREASRPASVVKVPLGAEAGSRIRAEAEALGLLGAHPAARPHVPAMLRLDREKDISAQEYVEGAKTSSVLTPRHVALLRALTTVTIGESPPASVALDGLLTGSLLPTTARAALAALTDALPPLSLGLDEIASTFEHGDFYPWNVFDRAGTLVALDWEFARPVGLPLWDAAHFHLRTSTAIRGLDPPAAIESLLTDVGAGAWTHLCEAVGASHAQTARYLAAVSVIRFFADLPNVGELTGHLADWVRGGA